MEENGQFQAINAIFPSGFFCFCAEYVANASDMTFHRVSGLDNFFLPRVRSWTPWQISGLRGQISGLRGRFQA